MRASLALLKNPCLFDGFLTPEEGREGGFEKLAEDRTCGRDGVHVSRGTAEMGARGEGWVMECRMDRELSAGKGRRRGKSRGDGGDTVDEIKRTGAAVPSCERKIK